MTQAPFFERMFSSDMTEARTNRVKVTDFKAQEFKTFLGFIYSGFLRDPFDLEQMLILANKYDVPALIDTCLKKVKAESDPSNIELRKLPIKKLVIFIKHFRLADRLGIAKFKQGCEDLLGEMEGPLGEMVDQAGRDAEGSPEGCNIQTQKIRNWHDVALNNVVEILVFAYRFSRETLKKKCMSHLMRDKCDLDQESFKNKLKAHPEVLFEIVRSYHTKLKRQHEGDSDDSDGADESIDSDESPLP